MEEQTQTQNQNPWQHWHNLLDIKEQAALQLYHQSSISKNNCSISPIFFNFTANTPTSGAMTLETFPTRYNYTFGLPAYLAADPYQLRLLSENNSSYIRYNLEGLFQSLQNLRTKRCLQIVLLHQTKEITNSFNWIADRLKDENCFFQSCKPLELLFNIDKGHKIKVLYSYRAENSAGYILVASNKAFFTQKIVRQILAFAPALMPDYFKQMQADLNTQGVPLNIVPFYKSLAEETPATWINILKTFCEQFDPIAAQRKREITNTIEQIEERAIYVLQCRVNTLQRDIAQYIDDLLQLEENLRKTQYILIGKQNTPSVDIFEAKEYWFKNEHLIGTAPAEDRSFIVQVWAPVNNFDPEVIKKWFTTPTSSFFRHWDSHKMPNGVSEGIYIRDIFYKLFITCEYTLFFEDTHIINIASQTIQRNTDNLYRKERGCSNPHFRDYNCYGSWKREILQSLSRPDYLLALEQIIACEGSINFADGAVFSTYTDKLGRHATEYWATPCIKTNQEGDDILYSFQQLVEKLWKESLPEQLEQLEQLEQPEQPEQLEQLEQLRDDDDDIW